MGRTVNVSDPASDAREFRRAMGHFATGLAIITADPGDGAVGLVVNSFTSVSLDPPLVLFCAAHTSTTWPVLRAAGAFCVNVLCDAHEELARLFFAKHPERFAAATWRPGPTGAPVLDGALLWLDCRLHDVLPGGDHDIVVGRVVSFGTANMRKSGDDDMAEPLLFYRGAYQAWSR